MSRHQVAWNGVTRVATVQAFGDALPVGSVNAGNFYHDHTAGDTNKNNDAIGFNGTHVLYHHVRDVMYANNILDMGNVTIAEDVTYVALTGVDVGPSTSAKTVGQTQQLTVTPTPGGASNVTGVWTTSHPSRATVSSTGLVTAVGAGVATITFTSTDGGFTDTHAMTVTV